MDPLPYTAEQVKQAVLTAGITKIPQHQCLNCKAWVGYLVEKGQLFFNANCACGDWLDFEPRTWQALADWINKQTDEAARKRILEACGLLVPNANAQDWPAVDERRFPS